MEAASARYAVRDRFAYPSEPAATPLQRYIQNACSPENFEPNLALSLEIADLINSKKGSAPREAAVAIVQFINHRNPNVSLLALSLLDICVKNCGYPFHLQISTKEFLNELVRRFPERPPVRTTRVQNRILELVEEWRRTICETSKYREDLGYIRDMHRLLAYKGYQFPAVTREDAAVLNPSDNLKSADEMEAEEREAQSAKLQELIRRGTPGDLQEANKLMKVMAGYDTRRKTDYRAKAAEEVGKVQQKARLLEEMLQGYKAGEKIDEEGVFEELANALASAHPKIQRMCEEESDDTEAVAKLFEINDSIHRTIERYKLIKKGDVEGANAIPRGTLGLSGAGVRQGPNQELSLIDFGAEGEESAAGTQPAAQDTRSVNAPKQAGNALEDDLLGLNMGDGNYGVGGGISLGGGPSNGMSSAPKTPALGNADIMAQFSHPQRTPQPSQPSIFSQPHQQQPPALQASTRASQDLFGGLSHQPATKPATPVPPSIFSASTGQAHQQYQPKKSDPFAALATPPRASSPFQFQSRSPVPASATAAVPPSGSGVDLLGMGNNGTSSSATPATAAGDDEWTFSSALPESSQNAIVVTDSAIKTVFAVSRATETELVIQSSVSNKMAQTVGDLTFQLAVTKGYTLRLEPQSSRTLAPKQQNGVTQTIHLLGVAKGKGTGVKMRWRASYTVQAAQGQGGKGEARQEQGEIDGLGVP